MNCLPPLHALYVCVCACVRFYFYLSRPLPFASPSLPLPLVRDDGLICSMCMLTCLHPRNAGDHQVTRWSVMVGGEKANMRVGNLLATNASTNTIPLSRESPDVAVGTLVHALERQKGCLPTCSGVEDIPACVQAKHLCDYDGVLALNVPEKCPATCSACPPPGIRYAMQCNANHPPIPCAPFSIVWYTLRRPLSMRMLMCSCSTPRCVRCIRCMTYAIRYSDTYKKVDNQCCDAVDGIVIADNLMGDVVSGMLLHSNHLTVHLDNTGKEGRKGGNSARCRDMEGGKSDGLHTPACSRDALSFSIWCADMRCMVVRRCCPANVDQQAKNDRGDQCVALCNGLAGKSGDCTGYEYHKATKSCTLFTAAIPGVISGQ